MKRNTIFGGLAAALILAAALSAPVAHARITAAANDGDIWCAGPSGAETCVDSTGGVIPTTTNDADLGTSVLKWKALHITAGGITDGAIDTGDIASGAVTINKLGAGAVDTGALGSGAVTINKIRAGAVDTGALGSGAVNTGKILRDAIQTSKLMWGTVGPDTGKVVCIRGGNSGGFGVCSNSANIGVDGCGNCE